MSSENTSDSNIDVVSGFLLVAIVVATAIFWVSGQ